MSRSHHNAHSQQQNHPSQHHNSWFMSPNLVNSLFCSPGASSANCSNSFLNSSNVNNHLPNFLSTQHPFLPPNQAHPHSSQTPLSSNGSFPPHYHNGHQNFAAQSYSSMFPPNNSLANSSSMGSNGRLIVGQNNHHYQNSSNHSKSNRISRVNMNFNSVAADINQSRKYQPGYGPNAAVLSLPGSNICVKPSQDFGEKNFNHSHYGGKQTAWPSLLNSESGNPPIATKKPFDKGQSGKFNSKQSVKGMENIKLDNEGVHSNYNPLTCAFPKKSPSSASFHEGLESSNNVTDNCGTSNNSCEFFIHTSKTSETEGKCQTGAVKFSLQQNSLSVDEEELMFTDNDIVEISRCGSGGSDKDSKKVDNGDVARKRLCEIEPKKTSDIVVEIENSSESEGAMKGKHADKGANQTADGPCLSSRFTAQCAHSCLHTSSCHNQDFSNNERNFMWTSHNQVPLSNFAGHPQSAVVNPYNGSGTQYMSNGLMESPSNMPNYLPSGPQSNPNFSVNCSHMNNTGNNMLAAAYLASSVCGTHPGGIPNLNNKCNLYRSDNSYASTYHDVSSSKLWQYYITNRQTEAMYVRKVQLRNALHMVMSYVFENAGLFIVGSSMNGFGNDNSDMDLCLTITSKDLHQKKEAFVVLNQLVEPLRKCSFIKNLQLIRATVPILKFRDTLAGVDCDLNINNVVGIYNTHLLAMYNRIDWRLRPLGMYIKHWAQKVDLHDASRGRLSTYTLILMVIQYLQAGCKPPVLPCLQAGFPKQFSYDRQVKEVDMRLELPWEELRSNNTSKLSDLLMGFFEYYVDKFDFARMAVSIRTGKPIPIEMAIKQLPPHEQLQNVKSFKLYIEEPFSLTNVSRSLFDGLVFSRMKRCFRHSLQVMRLKQSLKTMFTVPTLSGGAGPSSDGPDQSRSHSNQSETASNSNQDDNSKTLPLSSSNDNSEKSDISGLDDPHLTSSKSGDIAVTEEEDDLPPPL